MDRRTLLRGAGVAVALPWLEAMAPSRAFGCSAARPPVRLAFFHHPNGIHMPNWRPKKKNAPLELPRTLKSLEPVRDRVLVISDLEAPFCKMPAAGHEPASGAILIGNKVKHSEVPEVGGISVDQLAARKIGRRTPVDSLALGIDPGIRGDHGYSGTYLSHISWRKRKAPVDLELNPRQLFDRLFGGRTPRRPDWNAKREEAKPAKPVDPVKASVLDLVREDARRMQDRLGLADQRKLEEYLEGLRSVERRIESAERDDRSHHAEGLGREAAARRDDPKLAKVILPDGRGIPGKYEDHVNLMLDILVLAFQTDTTRVGSFLYSYEKSGRAYPELGVRDSHHSNSHHQNKKDKHERLTRINELHVKLFSRMLQRMKSVEEGEGTLLDNVAICAVASISDGNKHNHDDLPVLLAGGGGGAFRGGRHLAPGRTSICNLYLNMLDAAGVPAERFGNSTGRLKNLS